MEAELVKTSKGDNGGAKQGRMKRTKKDTTWKWMRGLDSRLIRQIMEFEPDDVTFDAEMPKYIRCIIRTRAAVGRGIAICSVRDKHVFDVALGKTIAAGRALCALKEKQHSRPIRTDFDRTWLPSQVKLLQEMSQRFIYKSMYKKIH